MLRYLSAFFFLSSAFLYGQAASPDGEVLPMGPFQLPLRSHFEGNWVRSDGVYVLNVEVEKEEVAVSYHNPKPIHVEWTQLANKEGAPVLEVMLLDEGYPGSTYTLKYIPQYDVLAGTYQIPRQEPSEVYFKRQVSAEE